MHAKTNRASAVHLFTSQLNAGSAQLRVGRVLQGDGNLIVHAKRWGDASPAVSDITPGQIPQDLPTNGRVSIHEHVDHPIRPRSRTHS